MQPSSSPDPTVLICAGEVSGDEHAAKVVAAARRLRPNLRFVGVAGPRMVEAGVIPLFAAEELAVVGIFEVVRHLPTLRRVMRRLDDELASGRVSICMTVDYPGFNMRLAARARRHGVATFHYIAPTVWAWGKHRINGVRRVVDRLALIFDFEEKIWRQAGVDAHWVGHPLLDEQKQVLTREALYQRADAPPGTRLVGLLPGSRDQEIRRLLEPMLEAAALLSERDPGLRFLLPRASGLDPAPIARAVAAASAPVTVIAEGAASVMAHSEGALVASGTATLQATLAGLPHVLVYRVAPATWAIGRAVVDLRHLGLANIIAGRTITPELLQQRATPMRMAAALSHLLYDAEQRGKMLAELARVRCRLGTTGAAERVAELLLGLLGQVVPRATLRG
jgi:lipid-A-disaccharide synthase